MDGWNNNGSRGSPLPYHLHRKKCSRHFSSALSLNTQYRRNKMETFFWITLFSLIAIIVCLALLVHDVNQAINRNKED
jgi:predicted nucleic acid-binding Zn ribbon protein